ncbi:tRNA1(Val) (adenine(37)-N6)-methyltransferase [Pseudoalteromonas sp. SSM20]|uniref:tRNA1(Val) (adenine(37)-N6)-methyltransferase n=1 Tax=Pseudoalteromonas sp. SSM20 TaxID=3139394 RepID=UPI003BA95523
MSGFTFKQFHINHDKCAMKVGTDGILLGALAPIEGANTALDIGTGTGLIALMLKQRAPSLAITAVEIDLAAYNQAKENISASPWTDLNVWQGDIKEFQANTAFDLIVSNPPFFNDSLKSDNVQRMTARHTDGLSFDSLCAKAASLLSKKGRFCVVLPTTELSRFESAADNANLMVIKKLWVFTSKKKAAKRVLLCLAHNDELQTLVEEELIIHAESGEYSTAFKALCRDFYLNF